MPNLKRKQRGRKFDGWNQEQAVRKENRRKFFTGYNTVNDPPLSLQPVLELSPPPSNSFINREYRGSQAEPIQSGSDFLGLEMEDIMPIEMRPRGSIVDNTIAETSSHTNHPNCVFPKSCKQCRQFYLAEILSKEKSNVERVDRERSILREEAKKITDQSDILRKELEGRKRTNQLAIRALNSLNSFD